MEAARRQFTAGKEELSSSSKLIDCCRLNKRHKEKTLGTECLKITPVGIKLRGADVQPPEVIEGSQGSDAA